MTGKHEVILRTARKASLPPRQRGQVEASYRESLSVTSPAQGARHERFTEHALRYRLGIVARQDYFRVGDHTAQTSRMRCSTAPPSERSVGFRNARNALTNLRGGNHENVVAGSGVHTA